MLLSTKHLIIDQWKPITVEDFTNSEEFVTLKINRANINSIPSKFINEITNLTEFHVTNGNLTINNDIYLPPKLQLLNFTNNGLKMIPNIIQNTSALEILVLKQNALKNSPKQILSYYKGLRKFDLNYNNLSHISQEILPLKNLEKLKIDENNINELNTKMFDKLKNLKELHLEYNAFEILPE